MQANEKAQAAGFDLSAYGFLRVCGKEASKLLQGQLTCDVLAIKPQQSNLCAHCNAQGRVISLFRLFYFQDAYYLMMHVSMLPIAQTALKKYAIFYRTEVTDATGMIYAIGMSGTTANTIGKIASSVQTFSVDSTRHMLIGDHATRQTMCNELVAAPIATPNAWQLLDIDAGIPTLYPETSAMFLPHELGLHKSNAIHFEKGCYTGQEIIARIHYRGKLKKNLYRAQITGPSTIKPGSTIYYELEREIKIGATIVDSCHASSTDQIALILADGTIAKNYPLFMAQDRSITFTLLD